MPEKTTPETIESRQPSPHYYERLKEIDDLNTEQEESVFELKNSSYIEQRLAELNSASNPRSIGPVFPPHSGFINSDSKIYRSLYAPPFTLNDKEPFTILTKTIREMKQNPGWQSFPTKQMIPSAIQSSLGRYFGNLAPTENDDYANQQFYSEQSDLSKEFISISELKGKSIAVCMEKAALSQNLLEFVGLDADLVVGNISMNRDDSPGLHAYNIIHAQNGILLFDPTHPKITKDESGKLLAAEPSLYVITEEQLSALKSGQSIEVTRQNTLQHHDGTTSVTSETIIYTGQKTESVFA